MNPLARFFLSGCGTGFVPVAPGTAGSLLGSGIAGIALLFFSHSLGILPWIFMAGGLGASLIGIILLSAFGKSIKQKNSYDAHWITLDEISGVWIASVPAFFSDFPLWSLGIAFVLFRIFDIFKPFGIRRIDEMNTISSVFVDDLAAGAISAVLLGFGIFFVN